MDAAELSLALTENGQLPLRPFHCHGCGRRLLRYRELGGAAQIIVRCRDCKTPNVLRGADVPALLEAVSHGRET